MKGISLAFERLVEQRKKEGGSLVLWQDGQVVIVKARDIQLKTV